MTGDPPEPRPSVRTVLEPIAPEPGSFDAGAMARGVPGVPRRFAWRGRTYVVAEVLDLRRESENYSGSPRDTYAKRHVVRVRTETGEVMVLSASRGSLGHASRWILREIE
jgi:hypothetical protein